MPSDLPQPEAPSPPYPELLGFLKGKDNPFDLFVAARKPDASFPRFHVPSLYREVFDPLSAALDRYRLSRATWESDLPRSGVLVIQGIRGAGKTHMVHALQRRSADSAPWIVVVPPIYEAHRPFLEYLLHQLVRHFQNETDGSSPGTLEILADALTRKVLVQAFHGMTEVEWLAWHVRNRSTFWQYLWGLGAKRLVDAKRQLIGDLEQWTNGTILEVCQLHEQQPQVLLDLAEQHIDGAEARHTLGGQIRRGLYTRLVQLAFGGPREGIYEYLLDGYTEVEAKTQPSRETLVDELLQALLELCLLAGMPVVFAFDALETLFGDPPEAGRCQPFFKGLADALDSHRGIPFLLFAELGYWQRAKPFRSEYAEQHFQQGVMRVPGHGSLSILSFPQVSAKQLGEIVAARMNLLFTEFYECEKFDAPAIFPFTDEDLLRIARSAGDEPPLRQALQALRDRYDELVNGLPATKELAKEKIPPQDSSLIEALESSWQREVRAAQRKLEDGSPAALADEIHEGIARWLECLAAEGASTEVGRPTAVCNMIIPGSHPTFGQVTRLQWTDQSGHCDVGIGLLLGEKRAMPRDLEAKLKMIATVPKVFEFLIILWPRGTDLAPPAHERLPTASRTIWDQYVRNDIVRHVRLQAVALEDLARWLALPRWLGAIQTEAVRASVDLVHHFVAERTRSLLSLVSPRS